MLYNKRRVQTSAAACDYITPAAFAAPKKHPKFPSDFSGERSIWPVTESTRPTTSTTTTGPTKGNKAAAAALITSTSLCAVACFPLTVILSPSETRELYVLYDKARTKVNENDAYHQQLMGEYWGSLFPGRSAPPTPSADWILAGFQSNSPWTDFRGGGLLALESIVYFARFYTREARSLMQDCMPRTFRVSEVNSPLPSKEEMLEVKFYYPFAASFINLAYGLLSFLRITSDLQSHFEAIRCDRHQSSSWPLHAGTPEAHRNSTNDEVAIKPAWYRRDPMSSALLARGVFKKGSKRAVKRLAGLLAKHPAGPYGHLVNRGFGDLFSYCCIKLHKEWIALCHNHGNLLGFQTVIDRTYESLVEAAQSDSLQSDPAALKQCFLGS